MTEHEEAPLARQLLTMRQEMNEIRAALRLFPGPAALQEMVEQLAGLGDRVDAIEAAASEKAKKLQPWDWSVHLPALAEGGDGDGVRDAHAAWVQLTEWVESVLGGLYRLVTWEDRTGKIGNKGLELSRPIPPCWNQHPDLIAELGWLCQEWLRIYRPPYGYGSPARAGDWHDRYLLGLRKRIGVSTAAACRFGHLQDSPTREPARDPGREPGRTGGTSSRADAARGHRY
ncbi:hypothetical protein [Planomonospora sp. ID82291]|uniref:hypothetical protein n=1 Tax=Planomonospora sp. ID82291 TaxID=2738136 RepID=UPI0018C38D15|nr:hypothetical protein [Planomonospora sp. ID82291]MBG0819118.1 hypothetical protein [Planomonospora sp. ID82291]